MADSFFWLFNKTYINEPVYLLSVLCYCMCNINLFLCIIWLRIAWLEGVVCCCSNGVWLVGTLWSHPHLLSSAIRLWPQLWLLFLPDPEESAAGCYVEAFTLTSQVNLIDWDHSNRIQWSGFQKDLRCSSRHIYCLYFHSTVQNFFFSLLLYTFSLLFSVPLSLFLSVCLPFHSLCRIGWLNAHTRIEQS